MKAAKANSGRSIYEWLKNPSSWISLSACIISLLTFFLVYADKGRIKILLPYSVGIGISSETNDLDIVVPATFSNTGAPRTMRHILLITGHVSSLDESVHLDNGPLWWTYENKFVGEEEFFRRYPTKKNDGDKRDYIVYEGRAIPFTLKGDESITKIMELEMPGTHPDVVPGEFKIELILHTESGNVRESKAYKCPHGNLQLGEATWCVALSGGDD